VALPFVTEERPSGGVAGARLIHGAAPDGLHRDSRGFELTHPGGHRLTGSGARRYDARDFYPIQET